MTSSRTEPGSHPESLTLELKVAGSEASEVELLKQRVKRLEEQLDAIIGQQPQVIYTPMYPSVYTAPAVPWSGTVTVTGSGVTATEFGTNVCSGTAMPSLSHLQLVQTQ